MSTKHGGYSDEELRIAAGAAPPPEESAQARMDAFASTIPVDGIPASNAVDEGVQGSGEPAPALAPEKRVRRIKATPKKAKRILSSIPEKILMANGIELDEDDKAGLAEATDFLEDIFGFEFEVPEEKLTIHSRWLAFLYPLGVVLLILAKHKMGFALKISDEEKSAEGI